MTAVLEVSTVDIYTPAQRQVLEARWEAAGRDLDEARRHVEIAVGLLYPLLRVELLDAFVCRWLSSALDELAMLDVAGELPRGAR